MARQRRLYLAGYSYHLVHRGHNRQAIFHEPSDYIRYQDYLLDALLRYGVVCHAYVQMSNHVHLLLSPSCSDGISRVMSLLGNRYVRHFNRLYQRSGGLWENRHFSCAVHTDRYLWACYRYIELNPVRAQLAPDAESYYWSSYRCNALHDMDELVTPHPCWLGLGRSDQQRSDAYRSMFLRHRHADDFSEIRRATRRGLTLENIHGPMPPVVPITP